MSTAGKVPTFLQFTGVCVVLVCIMYVWCLCPLTITDWPGQGVLGLPWSYKLDKDHLIRLL